MDTFYIHAYAMDIFYIHAYAMDTFYTHAYVMDTFYIGFRECYIHRSEMFLLYKVKCRLKKT